MVEFLKPESEVKSKVMLNLGSGTDIRQNWINADIAKIDGLDFVIDIESEELPLDDGSISLILLSHVIEHVDNIRHLLNEIFRVLKPGGKLYIIVPAFSSNGAFQDPTHVRFFTDETFKYLSGEYFDYYFGNVGQRAKVVLLKRRRTSYYNQLYRYFSPIIRLIGKRRFDNYVDNLFLNMTKEYHVIIEKL